MNRRSFTARSIVLVMAFMGGLTVAPSARAECKVTAVATLPVTMVGGQPKVAAKVNGADATFAIYTGQPFSFITPASAAEFGLRLSPLPSGTVREGRRSTNASAAVVKTFTLAGAAIPRVGFIVAASEGGNDGGGFIGEDFLGQFDAEYDLANGVIRLWDAQGCGASALAYWDKAGAYSVMDIEARDVDASVGAWKTITGKAFVNGAAIRVKFATETPVSFLWRDAAQSTGIDLSGKSVTAIGYTQGADGRRAASWIVPVATFKIGQEEIRQTHLRVSNDTRVTPNIPGMFLGADFFLSHRIYVANSQHKLYFTYNGGPVFDLTATPAATPQASRTDARPPPIDADGYARRGAASAARGEFGPAIADLTQAITLAPTESRYRYERAVIYGANSQRSPMMVDLDKTLELKPDDVSALLFRAKYRLADHDTAGATADLNAVDTAAPSEADARLILADLYETADALPRAVAEYDLWIKAHPADNKRGQALKGRCWVRALLGEGLDLALNDCDAALRADPKDIYVLDNRGLVLLRQGAFDKAIADYDAVLAQNPKAAWALYCRGLAKLHKGLTTEGNADIAVATALQPGFPAKAKAHGIGP